MLGYVAQRDPVHCRMLHSEPQFSLSVGDREATTAGFLLACGQCPALTSVWEWKEAGQGAKIWVTGPPSRFHSTTHIPRLALPPSELSFLTGQGGHLGRGLTL